MFPANELARKHPFILNCKLEPLRWAKLAVRGRLPVYIWNTVLMEMKHNTGEHCHCDRSLITIATILVWSMVNMLILTTYHQTSL